MNAYTCGRPQFCHSTVNMGEHNLTKTFIHHYTTKTFCQLNSHSPRWSTDLQLFAFWIAQPIYIQYHGELNVPVSQGVKFCTQHMSLHYTESNITEYLFHRQTISPKRRPQTPSSQTRHIRRQPTSPKVIVTLSL